MNNISNKYGITKIVLTGPTGVVGHAIIEECLNNGIQVFAIVHASSSRISSLPVNPLLHIIKCDLCDLSKLNDEGLKNADAFYHLAWDGTYGIDRQNPVLQESNIKYAIDAADLANRIGCKCFVGVGSQSEFGHKTTIMHPYDYCNPDNCYGAAKLSAMFLTRCYCNAHNIKHIWCRIISMYGPYDSPKTLIMTCINNMLRNEPVNLTKCDQVWDYLYSKDAAKMFLLCATKGKNNSIYCFGSGKTKKLKEYVEIIRKVTKTKSVVNYGAVPYYDNQVMYLKADIKNLKNDFSKIELTTFNKGIRDIINSII